LQAISIGIAPDGSAAPAQNINGVFFSPGLLHTGA
jgi:hypothetical protein